MYLILCCLIDGNALCVFRESFNQTRLEDVPRWIQKCYTNMSRPWIRQEFLQFRQRYLTISYIVLDLKLWFIKIIFGKVNWFLFELTIFFTGVNPDNSRLLGQCWHYVVIMSAALLTKCWQCWSNIILLICQSDFQNFFYHWSNFLSTTSHTFTNSVPAILCQTMRCSVLF